MKIGMMSLWNAANGASVHAELVGKAWMKAGHQLRVFSAKEHPDSRSIPKKKDDLVVRHFSVDQVTPVTRASWFDSHPLLEGDYEVFVAQNVERLPTRELLEIFPKIKEKAVTVQVVHEGRPPQDPLFYKFDWNAIVCFDERYRQYLVDFFPKEIIHIIPYPCHPLRLGDKVGARVKLGFQLNKKIIFSFGFRNKELIEVLPILEELTREQSLRYVILAYPGADNEILADTIKGYDFVDLRESAVNTHELYTYLHASDVFLIHRESSLRYKAVLSSTVALALGSGCPILYQDSNYVELHGNEVIKYLDFKDMKGKICALFETEYDIQPVAAYLDRNNAVRVAETFLRLFKELLEVRNHEGVA